MATRSKSCILAGWSTRDFTLEDFAHYLETFTPSVIEVSKDLIDGAVSTKGLHLVLTRHLESHPEAVVSFAATTDLTTCAGLGWDTYRNYLAIQSSQARFLRSSYFRFFVGRDEDFPQEELLGRLEYLAGLLAPIIPAIEIHCGWESDITRLRALVAKTSLPFVVDFANGLASGLAYEELSAVIPANRILYFHARNFQGLYIEHPKSIEDEKRWISACPDVPLLWEPKELDCQRIKELANEFGKTH
jgi:hypothetical protein